MRATLAALLDADVAGAGFELDEGAAAAHFPPQVVALERALHGDGALGVDFTRAGLGVEVEAHPRRHAQADAAGAGGQLPGAGRLPFGGDVAAAGFGPDGAHGPANLHAAGARIHLDFAGAGLLQGDVAAP